MANIVIVSTTNSIKVTFGAYFPNPLERNAGTWEKAGISFHLATNFVEVDIKGERDWYVSHDGNSTTTPTFQIDSVDGTAPTSVADLYAKLQAIIA